MPSIKLNIAKIFILSLLFLIVSYHFARSDESDVDLETLLSTRVSKSTLYHHKISESPNSILIISSEEIALFGYQSLTEIIATLQGMFTRGDMNYEYAGARGFDRVSCFNNTLVLLNGHVINENVYGSQTFDNALGIDMHDISRVEIVQGPASTLYGSGAMVSLINIVLKQDKEINGLIAGVKYGSYNNKYGHFSFGKSFDDLSVTFMGRLGESEGRNIYFEHFHTEDNDGIAYNLDWEKYYGSTFQAKYKDFVLNFYYANREKAIPNAPYESDFNTPPTKSRDERAFVNLKYKKELGVDKLLNIRLFYDNYNYFDVFQYDAEPFYDADNGRWFGTDIDFLCDITPKNRLTFGTNISRNHKLASRLYTDDEVIYSDDIPFTLVSAFILNNYQILSNLAVNVGIRADYLSYSSPNYNPRFALIYNPTSKTTLKYLLNSGFRTPSIYERFTDDPTFKDESHILKKESLLSNEIIWENIVSENFHYTFSLYYYRFENVIEYIFKEPEDPEEGGVYINIPYYNSKGIELGLRGKTDFSLLWYSNLSYQISTDTLNKTISNSPEFMAKVGIAYRLLDGLNFGIEGRYESKRKTVYNTYTDGFFLFNSNIGFSPNVERTNSLKFLNNFYIGLKVNNILDTKYYLPGANWIATESVMQYGRVVTFTLRVNI